VYGTPSSASQHGSLRRPDRGIATLRAASRRLHDPTATNRERACELGISSMSEKSYTSRDARLDSVCEDAREALRGVGEQDFRRKKNSAYISAEACSEAHRERAAGRESRESVLSDSRSRVLRSILQAA
jgi:hypothetical protein